MLDARRSFGRYSIPEPAAEFIYEATKLFDAKKKDPAKYLPRLRALWEQDKRGAEQHFQTAFGETDRSLENWLSSPPEDWGQLRERMLRRNKFGPVMLMREAARILKRVFKPAGLHITLLGPDGSGKSTLIERLLADMNVFFRRCRVYHFRPKFFEPPDQGGAVSEPHGEPPYGLPRSLAKIGYYFIDNWAAYLVRLYRSKIETTLIIFDRDFDDIIVDPKRYRLANASLRLARFLRVFLPKPDITFILDIPPDICHARKPELTLEELERQRGILRKLAASGGRYVTVPAERAPEEVADKVGRGILKKLISRRRHSETNVV